MTVRRLAEVQPESFAFTAKSRALADREIAKYPAGRQHSAVIALLRIAQEQHGGWLPEPAIRLVADILDMPHIRALEVATFYTMFNLGPVGRKAHIQVCGTTPCMLRGAEALKQICRERIHPEQQHVSDDGDFSWTEVECAGACVNAPMVQIEADTFEDLTPESFNRLIDDIAADHEVKPGPQIDRQFAEPVGGATTLTDPSLYGGEGRKPTIKGKAPVGAKVQEPRPAAKGDSADDLKLISGVGPKLEEKLNALGIRRYAQIAAWTADDIARVDDELNFRGRIERDDWVAQAKALSARGEGS
jgi:NADH-quinone oxidoreductase subunit E